MENQEDEIVITSKAGTVMSRMFVSEGVVYVFLPPHLVNEVLLKNREGVQLALWPPLPDMEFGEYAELDGMVCFKWELNSEGALNESMLYTRRLHDWCEIAGQ